MFRSVNYCTKIALSFFVIRDEFVQEYSDISNKFSEEGRKKTMQGLCRNLQNGTLGLHTVETRTIAPSIRLTCVGTDKFKTESLSINIINLLDRQTNAMSALLVRVLRRGTASHPDMASLSVALDELYGTRIEPMIRKKGELHCVGFYANFPDSRFLPDNEKILEKTISLLGEVLTTPDMPDGKLRSDYVESEKINLLDDIRAAINDKETYSINCLLKEMCKDEAFGLSRLGEEEDVIPITPEMLTAHHNSLLASSRIEILYCGAAEPDQIEQALRGTLKNMPERTDIPMPRTKVIMHPQTYPPKRISKALDILQGKISIGFRLGKYMENVPDFPALLVFNSLYGGSATSKLFLNVREKLALCYYASTLVDREKGVMIATSGVDFENFETAISEILSQLDMIKDGKIEDWELLSAKRTITSSIKMAMDRPGGLEGLYFNNLVSLHKYDPNELSNLVESVTLERVVNAASDITPDTIHTLTQEGKK